MLSIVVGFDGRPAAAPLLAAACEGIRWAGCEAIDLGAVTAPCLVETLDHLGAGGGLFIGNPTGQPHTAGVKFWGPGGRLLVSGMGLEELERAFRAGIDRPVRRAGPLRRFRADLPYLAALAESYHALRPLRVALRTTIRPVREYLDRLMQDVACRTIPLAVAADRLGAEAVALAADFAVSIEEDGEQCTVFDERGHAVPYERLLAAIAGHLRRDCDAGPVVLDRSAPAAVVDLLRGRAFRVSRAGPRRAEFERAMADTAAAFGCDARGRLWYGGKGPPSPDALVTLTLLLELLSRSDRRLSEVLDREARLR